MPTTTDLKSSQDTTPSILTWSLSDRPSSTEPEAKRHKPEDGSETKSTILTRQASNTYKTVDDVLRDVDTAVADIKDMIRPASMGPRNHQPETEISMKVTAFKQRAHELVRRGKAAGERKKTTSPANGTAASFTKIGGIGSNSVTQINANLGDNKMVLTLYGNAPGPKQLFSSLQIPTKLDGESRDLIQSLRDAALPTGISMTEIVPIQALGDDKKRVPTLGDLFPIPPTVPPMQPPKPSKIATTRSSTVGWYQPPPPEALSRGASYFKQNISSGHWLDYSNASPPQDIKRKHRDRALSLGGSKAPQVDSEPAESGAAKLDSLFRSAYSGFAPTKDDSAAVAPEGHMNRIWWQQRGVRAWERVVENENNLILSIDHELEANDSTEEIDVDKIQEIVDEMEKDNIDPSLVPLEGAMEKSAEEKDVEEILQGISELLETLNSYQRIRHMSLNAQSRPVGLISAADTTSLGAPSKPSESEQATYEILKSQLTLMIATLPPYAVAKLDADRLADLSISAKIEVLTDDHKGVMEEDEAGARAKAAAAASAASRATSSTPGHRPTPSTLYGNQYSSSRPAVPNAHQYYGAAAQTPVRPPSNNMQRPPATAPVPYQAQRPAAATPYRAQGYGTPTYPHQAPRPVPQQYTPVNQQYMHTPSSQPYMRPPSQNYQHVPQSAPQGAMNGGYPRQSYPHQGQPSQNGTNYQYGNGVNMPRQASPQKMYTPQQVSAQPRPYGTPTPSMPPNRQPYMQNSMGQNPMINGTPTQAPQPQYAHQPTGPSNYQTFMTTEQQATMMERQRAQLAQQQGMQQQARNAAQAAMGTPSKPQVNGNSAVAAGL